MDDVVLFCVDFSLKKAKSFSGAIGRGMGTGIGIGTAIGYGTRTVTGGIVSCCGAAVGPGAWCGTWAAGGSPDATEGPFLGG